MKNMIKLASAMAALLTVSQVVQATTLSGAIGFTGGVTYDTSSAGNASQVTTWITPTVNLVSGDFKAPAPFAIAPGSTAVFTSSVWNFNTVSPINNFWSVGGFTFKLLSSYIVSQGGAPGLTGYVVVSGSGIVSGNGYSDTLMSWSFTSQDPKAGSNPDSWTFSASSNSVPDGGATVMLLGLALSGAAFLKRKLTA
jgi:hypothetical protein